MKLLPETVLEKLGFEQLRNTIYNLTDSVRTHELIENLRPTSHHTSVIRLLAETDEMMQILQNPDPFPLHELPDIREYLTNSKAEGSIIGLNAFSDILKISKTARLTKSFFRSVTEDYPELTNIVETLIPLKDLEKEINRVVTENGELKDNASPKLKSIRASINRKKNDLRNTINRLMRNVVKSGMAPDEGPTIRNGRMVIPVLAEYKRKIQGFIHDVSATGQTVYLEPAEALHLNNEIRQLEAEERQEIERILRELTTHIRKNAKFIEQNAECLANIDLIRVKASISINLNAEIPIITKNKSLKLKKAFNTSLLLKNRLLPKEKRTKIVPLFLEMTRDENCLMITGPNAGGKSVAMKTIGLSALMLQSGFAIPADPTSEMPVFSAFYIDMGDDQSIEDDLSTFSSRLKWMQQTIEQFKEHSLIMIDEAGAGTDPDEGSALFQAFAEHLLQKQCKIIITTHHGSLKIFAHEHPKAVNGSMEFDQATLSPTYKFKKGVPGSSYAFDIAHRMNVNENILQRSRLLLGSAKNKMESLIIELENKAQQADELRTKYEVLKTKAENERGLYQQKLDKINKEKDKIRQQALVEAKRIIDSANKRVEKAVEQIAEKEISDKEDIKLIRSGISTEKQTIDKELHKIEKNREKQFRKTKKPPKIGDFVRFLDGNTTGELIELKGKNAVVQADGLRLKTKYKNLVKVEVKKPKKEKTKVSAIIQPDSNLNKTLKPSLDLRGMRADTALNEVLHYLDHAIFRGLNQVEIIHGLGDGILRSQVHSYLNERKDVKNFHLAHPDEGGDGCTIVNLK